MKEKLIAQSVHATPPQARSYLSASIAAVIFGALWGGWAFIANRSFGSDIAARAMLTQFASSFVTTFFFALIVERLYLMKQTLPGQILFAFVIPIGGLIGLLTAIHTVRGTPNILLTIAPATTVSALYCLVKIVKGLPKRAAVTQLQ